MNRDPSEPQRNFVVVTQTKSVGIAILLTLIFGPLGLFYATVRGALIVIFGIPAIFVGLAMVTAVSTQSSGGGLVALAWIPVAFVTTWVVSLVWSVTAVNAYNRKLLASGQ